MERVHQPTPDMRANLEYLTDDLEEPYALIGHVRFGEGHRALLILQNWRIYYVYSQTIRLSTSLAKKDARHL